MRKRNLLNIEINRVTVRTSRSEYVEEKKNCIYIYQYNVEKKLHD